MRHMVDIITSRISVPDAVNLYRKADLQHVAVKRPVQLAFGPDRKLAFYGERPGARRILPSSACPRSTAS